MGITIKSATWGDETAATDITDSIVKKAKDGYLDLVANGSLVPAIDLSLGDKDVSLSDSEKQDAKDAAIKICRGAQDKKCMDFNQSQLESSMVQKKIAEKQSSANIVSGRRLTLTYIDSTGNERTVAIPDGQAVKVGEKPTSAPIKLPDTFSEGTWGLLTSIAKVAFTILMTLLWVFSIVAPYRLLILEDKVITAYILTAVAILIPYSGLISTPLALAYFRYQSQPKTVPV